MYVQSRIYRVHAWIDCGYNVMVKRKIEMYPGVTLLLLLRCSTNSAACPAIPYILLGPYMTLQH